MRRYLPRVLAPRLRERIRSGHYTREGLRRAFARVSDRRDGFDSLDVLIAALLNDGAPGEPAVALEPQMVAYQPTPARVIIELLERAELTAQDTFYDLGAGLGHVCVLASVLSEARVKGIEIEPAYCAYARQMAQRMGARVEILEGDARRVPLDDGTVFFLFTPFRGELLRTVLKRLAPHARVFAHGPAVREAKALGVDVVGVGEGEHAAD
jgi:SAM-dependent methyltransferase